MISVAVSDCEVIVSGHAGYAPPGNDIICAAVSALTQSLASSLEALTEDKTNTEIDTGYVRIEYENLSEPGRLLVDSFFIGICGIIDEYPEYIRIDEPEGMARLGSH